MLLIKKNYQRERSLFKKLAIDHIKPLIITFKISNFALLSLGKNIQSILKTERPIGTIYQRNPSARTCKFFPGNKDGKVIILYSVKNGAND